MTPLCGVMDPETRAYYDGNSRGYSDSTMGNDLSDTMSRFLGHMRQGGRILDLGCGSGRDTKTLMSKGYDVVPVDGSEGMCRVASENLGMPVRRLDFSDLDYVKEFDGVWACASLLHVPSAELPRTIMLIHRSLRSDGVLFANFKEGVYGGFAETDLGVFPCILNYGARPTFHVEEKKAEAFLIGFTGDLYGRTVRVYPQEYFRPVRQFPSAQALRAQLLADVQRAQKRSNV